VEALGTTNFSVSKNPRYNSCSDRGVKKKKRACGNWLETFLEWTMPLSEAPESLLTWTGLFCISAVLKRKVKFSEEYTPYNVYANAYIMFVGPPGVVRKSTSSGYAHKLLAGLNEVVTAKNIDPAYIYFGPTSGSHVKIIEKMSETQDGAMTIIAGEFGNLVSTSPEETYDLLGRLFDSDEGTKRYEHSTRSHGDEVILNASLNLIGCTTPDWMLQNTGYMVGGGFAARTVFVFEDKARQHALFYRKKRIKTGITVEKQNKMQEALIKDLQRIGQLKGEFIPENEELEDRMEAWYQEYKEAPAEKGVETFKQRKHVHTLRTAMVLSLCESDELVITGSQFDQAIKLIDGVESKLSRGLSSMGRNPYSALLHDIFEYVQREGNPPEGKTVAYFIPDAPIAEIHNTLQVLKDSRQIERVDVDPPYLRVVKK